jgi:hypothetical protein
MKGRTMKRKHSTLQTVNTALEIAALASLVRRLGPRRAGRLAVATAGALLRKR